MKDFFLRWMINIAALFIVIYIAGGISADGWQSVVVAAFVLGLLNAFFKPAIIALTLPFNMLTLGFFTLIINAFIFYMTSKFVKGFNILGFWDAFWAALLFSVISAVISFILAPKVNIRYASFKSGGERPNKINDDNVIDVEGTVEK